MKGLAMEQIPEADYYRELERLLLELARLSVTNRAPPIGN